MSDEVKVLHEWHPLDEDGNPNHFQVIKTGGKNRLRWMTWIGEWDSNECDDFVADEIARLATVEKERDTLRQERDDARKALVLSANRFRSDRQYSDDEEHLLGEQIALARATDAQGQKEE